MHTVTFKITGVAPYSQSRLISSPKLGKETAKDHEARCWRDRMHVDSSGHAFIPPMAIKNALAEMAKFLGMQIPGKGKSTYTKHMEAGVMCFEPIVLHDAAGAPIVVKDIKGEWLFVPASGRRGDGKRVEKCFPVIDAGWTGDVTLVIMDEMITPEVLETHLHSMGRFIGLGRFRPRNNGYYGRFNVSDIQWAEMRAAA
jgi:hypothetical protein